MREAFQKFDDVKAPLGYLLDCPKALEEVSKVIAYGAKKYGRSNWRNATAEDKERLESAGLRHLTAFHNGRVS